MNHRSRRYTTMIALFLFLPFWQVPVALSDDHNPDKPEELERIESCGGFVSPPPEEGLSARVWLDQELTRIGLVNITRNKQRGSSFFRAPHLDDRQ